MSQPVSSAAVERWRKKIATAFEPNPEYLVPILQFIQEKAGYLPAEAMSGAARHLRIPTSKVYGVASFYAQFHFEPRGLHTVTVCRGTACHVRGSARILKDVEKDLGVAPGGTTDDRLFSLQTVACFGACARAPVVVVDEKVHGQQTSAESKRLVEGVRKASKKVASAKKAADSKKKKAAASAKKKAAAPAKKKAAASAKKKAAARAKKANGRKGEAKKPAAGSSKARKGRARKQGRVTS